MRIGVFVHGIGPVGVSCTLDFAREGGRSMLDSPIIAEAPQLA